MTVSWASQLCDELSRKFFNRGPARDSAGAPARDCARDHPRDKRTPVTRRNNSAEPRRQARPALNALAIARANLRGEATTPTHRTHSRPSHQYLRGVSAADTPARPLCTPPHAKAPRPAVAHFAQASGAATYRPPSGRRRLSSPRGTAVHCALHLALQWPEATQCPIDADTYAISPLRPLLASARVGIVRAPPR